MADPSSKCMPKEIKKGKGKKTKTMYKKLTFNDMPKMCQDASMMAYDGSFETFQYYCSKRMDEMSCKQCSGKWESDGTCTAPTKPTKVKCNAMSTKNCAKFG